MPTLPIPYRCIWCLTDGPSTQWDLSHVVPECLGNEARVLPRGVVCRQCNSYFGSKVEPVYLDDPLVHVYAVFYRLVDPSDGLAFRDKFFDATHPTVRPVERGIRVQHQLLPTGYRLQVEHTVRGEMVREYDLRKLAMLSRAFHKMAFESLAQVVYVKGHDQPIDPFDAQFDWVRKWARYGSPTQWVRPVLRRNSGQVHLGWHSEIHVLRPDIGVQIAVYGDWFGVSLTSPPRGVLSTLRRWAGENTENMWCLANQLVLVSDMPSSDELEGKPSLG